MFIGHFAVGFAAKRVVPRTSLAWLIAAPLFLDLLWPIFLLLGLETVRIEPGNTRVTPLDLHDYPYSHSLLMSVVWSIVFALAYFGLYRERITALYLGIGVFSHWVLDFVSHRPDMPLYPGSDIYLGLGLWNSVPATLTVELLMFAGGVALFTQATRARDRQGVWSWALMIVFLTLIYLGNIFGPPPPNVRAILFSCIAMLLFFPWAIWIDRHRELKLE